MVILYTYNVICATTIHVKYYQLETGVDTFFSRETPTDWKVSMGCSKSSLPSCTVDSICTEVSKRIQCWHICCQHYDKGSHGVPLIR